MSIRVRRIHTLILCLVRLSSSYFRCIFLAYMPTTEILFVFFVFTCESFEVVTVDGVGAFIANKYINPYNFFNIPIDRMRLTIVSFPFFLSIKTKEVMTTIKTF